MELAQASMAFAQTIQEEYANKKRTPSPRFKVRLGVAELKNIATVRLSKKLD